MAGMTLRGQVLFADGVLRPGEVLIEGERIASVRVVDSAPDDIIAPGFIDLQLNGGYGEDFTANPDTIYHVAARVLQQGVTAFLPTIITAPLDVYRKAFEVLSPLSLFGRSGRQARVLGLHLEGPYLSPHRSGAHNKAYLRQRADPRADGLLDPSVRLMTLAPELEHAMQSIRDLRARGIVASLGHSTATHDLANEAIDAGATWGTHLFNAMNPLHHREPGLLGALLAHETAMFGVIPDGVHVHPSIFKWLMRAAGPERMTIVTDAMAAAGMPPGEYPLGDRTVTVTATSARLPDGTLAGSILTMDQAVRNLVTWGACLLADALTMASTTPARLLGAEQIGRITPGAAADLAVLDETLHVRLTFVAGALLYDRENPVAML
ncbi:MAG: N-acetylglucosamine-6-phosphate deacetylase [Chloroflexi bacterium]|nr:N-acetylglucosamine-6-phosphate deacetylase [Chloroflexota bacterium]